MTKIEYIEIFNKMILGAPVSFKDCLLPMLEDYLTNINYERKEQVINLIKNTPQNIQNFMPDMVAYYTNKHKINTVLNKFNQTILYYE